MYIDNYSVDPDWCVIEEDFDISRVRHNESVMALGTGFLTIRSSFDEGFSNDEQNLTYNRMAMNVSLEVVPAKKSRWGAFIPLVQGKHPFWNVGVVNLPYSLGLEVYADSEKLDMENGKITFYKRWLDMKTATLYRTFIWETASGKKLNLLFRRFMNPDYRFACAQDLKIKVLDGGAADIELKSYIDNDVRTNGCDKFTEHAAGFAGDQVIYSDVTCNLGDRVMTMSRMICDKSGNHSIMRGERRVTANLSFRLARNEEACARKVSVQAASVYFDSASLLDEGIKLINSCLDKECESLHREHVTRWEKNWEISDIQIKANTALFPTYKSRLTLH